MIGVTIFGIFFTPVFYVVVRWFTERKSATPTPAEKKASLLVAATSEVEESV
jgi:hypothetical protein